MGQATKYCDKNGCKTQHLILTNVYLIDILYIDIHQYI